ncbi:hypothetical protein ACIQZG_04430 [Lysinibacillus sp. NPDC096418]|uniref:hypothetical protein n=1 Tax=Lysinibacillus sp. NPDC096418 TaxID=3364138 RepID=UPI003825BC6D
MDAKMLEKRIAILKEVNRLTSKCNCQSAKESESCANCMKIQNYGKRLLKLVNKRVQTSVVSGSDEGPDLPKTIWTEDMLRVILLNHKKMTYTQLANKLGVTRRQVNSKMDRLGLKCKVESALFQLYVDGVFVCEGSIRDIANETGYGYHRLYQRTRVHAKHDKLRMERVK